MPRRGNAVWSWICLDDNKMTTNIHLGPHRGTNQTKSAWQLLLWMWCGMSWKTSLSHPSAEQCDRLEDSWHMTLGGWVMKVMFNPCACASTFAPLKFLWMNPLDEIRFSAINSDSNLILYLMRWNWGLFPHQRATMFGASWFSQLHRRPAQRVTTMGAHRVMHLV